MAKKITVQGNYQYSEADLKSATLLRSFGWLVGKRSEHENKKGEKVFSIRRDLEIANDPGVKKNEKIYKKYNGKAAKTMKCRHGWGQFFAILFTILGLAAGGMFFLTGQVPAIKDIVEMINKAVKDIVVGSLSLGEDIANMIVDYLKFGFLGIGAISLIAIFCNKARFKKRMIRPKRKYALKYNGLARTALKDGAERVYELKANNRYLMTKNDRKLADLGSTMERVLDRGNSEEWE